MPAGRHLGEEGEVANGSTMTRRSKPDSSERDYPPRAVFKAGIAFDRTAKIMVEHLEQTKDSDFMVSLYVNVALAAELFLKCLLRRAGKHSPTGHKLQELFNDLPEEDQTPIRESFSATPRRNFGHVLTPGVPPTHDGPFDRFLSHVDDTFVKWRYNYEIRSLADASGLPEFVRAIRARIEDLEPEWRQRTEGVFGV